MIILKFLFLFWIGMCIVNPMSTITSFKHIGYTWKHYKAYNKLQMETFGFLRYKYHDCDKLLMYIFLPFLGKDLIKKLHKKFSPHHLQYDTVDASRCTAALFDWECARFTKPDKPANAYATIYKKDRSAKQEEVLFDILTTLHHLNPNIELKSNVEVDPKHYLKDDSRTVY